MLHRGTFYSIGGGFVVTDAEAQSPASLAAGPAIPFPFENAAELLEIAEREKVSIADIMMRNECAVRSEQEVRDGLDRIWTAMSSCIDRGLRQEGILPGGLNVKRRAAKLREALEERERAKKVDPLVAMDWINVWALAVNEENAAGGKVVTAPTNGAAGVVPAVLRYYDRFCDGTQQGRHTFLLTAGARSARSTSAMRVSRRPRWVVRARSASLVRWRRPASRQRRAARTARSRTLPRSAWSTTSGLTCDPIRGLVQIPCIERNAMGAVKAIDASRLALMGDGTHHVTLDRVIETMRRTGADMHDSYKETSLGGLAVNVPEC